MYFSADMSDSLTDLLVDIVFLSGGVKEAIFVLLVLGLSLFFCMLLSRHLTRLLLYIVYL